MPSPRTSPFEAFSDRSLKTDTALREAITSAYRLPEPEIVPALIDAAAVEPQQDKAIRSTAEKAVRGIRAKGAGGRVEGLMHEYALSSQEGVALM